MEQGIRVFLELGSSVRVAVVEAVPKVGQTLRLDDGEYRVVNRWAGPECDVVALEPAREGRRHGAAADGGGGWVSFGPPSHT